VLLTSVDQVDFGKMVIDFGIAAHLTKPARSAILLGTVISVIQKARAQIGKAHFVREPVVAQAAPVAPPAFTVIRGPVMPAATVPESMTTPNGPRRRAPIAVRRAADGRPMAVASRYRCRVHHDEPVTWRGTGCQRCGQAARPRPRELDPFAQQPRRRP